MLVKVHLTNQALDALAAHALARDPLAQFEPCADENGDVDLDADKLVSIHNLRLPGETVSDVLIRMVYERES